VTTVQQYVQLLRPLARKISVTLGEDVGKVQRTDRILLVVQLGALSVLIKVLVDKGILTDAELQAAYNAAAADPTYPVEPIPVDPQS
jgi:hypothetical protein